MEQKSSKGFVITAFICGLASILCFFVGYYGFFLLLDMPRSLRGFVWAVPLLALQLGILGIVFGAVGMKKASQLRQPKGLAVAGLVCGIIGTVISLNVLVLLESCASCNWDPEI